MLDKAQKYIDALNDLGGYWNFLVLLLAIVTAWVAIKHKDKIVNTIKIFGDRISNKVKINGNNNTVIQIVDNNGLKNTKSPSIVVETLYSPTGMLVNKIINTFENQNPGLSLKIDYKKDVVNYEINNTGRKPIDAGKLTVFGTGIEKYKRLIEHGEEVLFQKGEFKWDSSVNGLPPSNNIEETLHIKPSISLKPIKGRLILVRDNINVQELYTHLTVTALGQKSLKAIITGGQFVGNFNLHWDYVNSNKPEPVFTINYDSPDILNLQKTLLFIANMKCGDIVRFVADNINETILGFMLKTLESNDMQKMAEFIGKMIDVFRYYSIPLLPFTKLNENDIKSIEILHAYINKYPITILSKVVLTIKGKLMHDQWPVNDQEHYSLSGKMSSKYILVGQTMHIENYKFIMENPKIVKMTEPDTAEVYCERLINDFGNGE
jgi:hypothetical protein